MTSLVYLDLYICYHSSIYICPSITSVWIDGRHLRQKLKLKLKLQIKKLEIEIEIDNGKKNR